MSREWIIQSIILDLVRGLLDSLAVVLSGSDSAVPYRLVIRQQMG